jgi:hypothetical protein
MRRVRGSFQRISASQLVILPLSRFTLGSPQHFESVHAGHHDVDQHQVGAEFCHLCQRRSA